MNQVIANVICCPACHGRLRSWRHRLECDTCRVTYRIQIDVPVFFLEDVIAVSSDHVSRPIGADFEELWAGRAGPSDGFDILQNLPQAARKKSAAGFELIRRKPIRQ